jgi:hypothetical protein
MNKRGKLTFYVLWLMLFLASSAFLNAYRHDAHSAIPWWNLGCALVAYGIMWGVEVVAGKVRK